MASKLTDLANQKTAMQLQTMSKEAYQWLLLKIQDIRRPTSIPIGINREAAIRKISRVVKGKLFCFYYDPKGKADLPYYDRFPLVIPLERYSDGFLGLNLHYLHPTYRARLMDRLLDTVNNDKFDETTKMRLNYSLLTSVARLKYFKPCFKHYLYTQLESRIMLVPSSEWEIAMYLPTEKFVGANKTEVWRQSKKMLTG